MEGTGLMWSVFELRSKKEYSLSMWQVSPLILGDLDLGSDFDKYLFINIK